ncbi:MAG: hypothetical protein ACLFUI_04030 [Halanaerobiales bacterium]
MKNSELFLNSFSEIEDFLERYTKTIRHDSFGNLVHKASRSNSVIRKYKADLFELKDLRNAIVHERSDGHVIAEPHDGTVKLIQKIAGLLKNPPRVLPTFKGDVLTLNLWDKLKDAVNLMQDKSYTQIPILDSGSNYVSLLTTNTIVRWLGSHQEQALPENMNVKIEEVLEHKEDNNVCLFIKATTSFPEVLDIFEEYKNTAKKLEAVIITENGRPTDYFLGIITNWDLPVIYHSLENYE